MTEAGGGLAEAGSIVSGPGLLPPPTPEGGLFGPSEPAAPDQVRASEQLDWVSASAWAEAPWDERAEQEAAEFEALDIDDELEPEPAEEPEPVEEATRAPKVPAALPMRRRKPPSEPIRSRGSGEWFYADPPGREPLVSRRTGIAPTVMLAVLGLLVVSVVVMLVASQIGGDDGSRLAAASPTPLASIGPAASRAPLATAQPSADPSPTPEPKREFYRVKEGDTLTGIAAKLGVRWQHLQCLNGLLDRNLVVVGARYEIPPEGFECPKGWRSAVEGS
jgi:LysM repeat protein